MQNSGQGMSSGGKQDMGSSGSNIVVQNNINIINQPIIVIATNAGGSSQTQQVASQIQAPAATHTVCYASIPTPLGPCINMLKIQVTVGGDAGLVYSPDTIKAAMYDMVQFNFMAKNHTVTQSTFPKPCNKMMGGIDSGFMPNSGTGTPPMMMVQVNSTMPIWFYCRQKKPMPHCGAGMTFSINPTADKSQAAFKAAAIAINGTGATAGMMASGGSMAAGASVAAGTYMAATASVAPAMTMVTQAAVAATTMAMAAQAAAATQAASVAQQNQGSMNSGSNSMMVSGSGQTDASGSCTCSCMCGVQAFAAGSGLGLGMYGGLPGKLKTSS